LSVVPCNHLVFLIDSIFLSTSLIDLPGSSTPMGRGPGPHPREARERRASYSGETLTGESDGGWVSPTYTV